MGRSTIARWTAGSSNSQNLIFSHFFPLAVKVAAILATSLQLNVLSAQICQMKYSVKGGGQIDVNVQKMMPKDTSFSGRKYVILCCNFVVQL